MTDLFGALPAPSYGTFTDYTRTPFSLLTRVVPEPVLAPFNPVYGPTTGPPIDQNYQNHLTSLQNKYQQLSPMLAQLPEPIRNSLINFDAQRVARGSAPLTSQQTVNAAQTALTNVPATPNPEPNPLNIIGNFRSD